MVKNKSKLADRILLRARAVHSGDFSNQLTLTWVFGHYFNLVKIKGPYTGTKDMVAIGFLLYKKFAEFISTVRHERNLIPQLQGAPRDWIGTIETLQNELAKYSRTADKSSESSLWFNTLANIMAHSNNNADSPTVTIIIPACDNMINVATCIESIASFPSSTNYIIFIADRSKVGFDLSMFSSLTGVHVLRQNSNYSQSESVNHAVNLVTTPYLLILNPATLTCPGWLDEMVNEISRDPIHGIVGPRILAKDLAIREAGGVIFRNGEINKRGRISFSDNSCFNFSLNVDFVSSCTLLIRRELWNQLGGFDVTYESNDYRDAELCLRAHSIGQSVRYAPLACVIHYGTTDLDQEGFNSDATKGFQKSDHTKFLSVYHEILATHTTTSEDPQVNSHFSHGIKIVCILDRMPDPLISGGEVDFDLTIRYLVSLNYQVSVLFTTTNHVVESFTWRALGVLCEQFDSPYSKQLIAECEIVFSFGLMVGIQLCHENFKHEQWIHYTSDIASRRLRTMNLIETNAIASRSVPFAWYLNLPRNETEMWELEKQTLERPTTVLFVTQEDVAFAKNGGANGNFVHLPIFRGAPETSIAINPLDLLTVGFVGNFKHSPNPDAVNYFLDSIWPIIKERVPNACFLLWGSEISDQQIATWSSVPGVEIRGWFARWEDVVAHTRVFVSPLRFGAGMKGKVVSALLHGRPVVGTRISFEGFNLSQLNTQIFSDDPTQIVESVIACLTSDEKCSDFLRSGIAGLGSQFSRDAEIKRLREVLPDL